MVRAVSGLTFRLTLTATATSDKRNTKDVTVAVVT